MTSERFHTLNPHVTRSAFHAEARERAWRWDVIFTDVDGERYIVYSDDFWRCIDWIGGIPA